jgi:hypothetical protein
MSKSKECKNCSDNRDHNWGLCECSCHNPPTHPEKEWEEELREIMNNYDLEEVKSFISKLLKEAYRNGQHSMIPVTPEKTIKMLKKKGLLD